MENITLTQQKFGTRIAEAADDLGHLSIEVPWIVGAESYRPELLAKWLAMTADKLNDEKIMDARANSADDNFWFKQATP